MRLRSCLAWTCLTLAACPAAHEHGEDASVPDPSVPDASPWDSSHPYPEPDRPDECGRPWAIPLDPGIGFLSGVPLDGAEIRATVSRVDHEQTEFTTSTGTVVFRLAGRPALPLEVGRDVVLQNTYVPEFGNEHALVRSADGAAIAQVFQGRRGLTGDPVISLESLTLDAGGVLCTTRDTGGCIYETHALRANDTRIGHGRTRTFDGRYAVTNFVFETYPETDSCRPFFEASFIAAVVDLGPFDRGVAGILTSGCDASGCVESPMSDSGVGAFRGHDERLFPPTGELATFALTDEEGRYELRLESGPYTVCLIDEDLMPVSVACTEVDVPEAGIVPRSFISGPGGGMWLER